VLSPAQQRGVRTNGHCLITACPGSGKTSTLAARAARLLDDFPDARVAAVTFTNDAAKELGERIARVAPQGSGKRVMAGTFHKLCKDHLDRNRHRVRLISEVQAADIIRRAWQRYCSEDSFEDVHMAVQAAKASLHGMSGSPEDPHFQVYLAYEAALRERGLSDFQDLLLLTVRGIRDGSVPLFPVQFLLVDEVQDADEVQWELIMLHANAGIFVTAVGDDDQSIYGWRWAQGYEGMRSFLSAARPTHVALDTSYRCAPEILARAARVIENNEARVEKTLVAASDSDGKARIEPCYGVEAELVTSSILDGEQWAVLARSNAAIDAIETMLSKECGRGAYTRLGGRSYFDKRGPALLLSAAQSIAQDDMRGVEALASEAGLPTHALESILKACRGHGPGGLSRFLEAAIDTSDTDAASIGLLQTVLREWRADLAASNIGVMLSNIVLWMEANLPSRIMNVSLDPCLSVLSKLQGTLLQRLVKLREKRANQQRPPITLATLHASKGLEFDKVWIIGCEQGVLPHKNGDVDEERRLFYVGMTRARHELVLSYRVDTQKTPSVFLVETGLLSPR